MAEDVRISREALEAADSCGDHVHSPEWTGEYGDIDATMRRLARTHLGRGRLKWLAEKELIPRTVDQVLAYLEEHPCEIYDGPHRGKKPFRIAPEPPPPPPTPAKLPPAPPELAARTLALNEAVADFDRRTTPTE